MKKFNVREDEILQARYSDRFRALAGSVAERARNFYRLARQTLPAEDRRTMVAAELMGSVYWRLLKKLERQQFNVFGPQPARLSQGHKILLILQSWMRSAIGATSSNYGPS
jgi:phytoene synthase